VVNIESTESSTRE